MRSKKEFIARNKDGRIKTWDEIAEEIQFSWLQGLCHIGITSGASTDEQTINEVLVKLKASA